MLVGRVYRIFQYYAAETARLDQAGSVLCDASGSVIGAVERIRVEAGRFMVEGHAVADRVILRQAGAERATVPVADPPGAPPRFRLDVPLAPGVAHVITEQAGTARTHQIAGFGRLRLKLARAARLGPFCLTLLRMAPVIWRWKRGGDLGAREAVKEALGLVPPVPAGILDQAVLHPGAPPGDPGAFTIVMPIHNALDLLRTALGRVEDHSPPGWHLVAVEDGSTDPALRPWLRDWAAARPERVTLILLPENLGFVGAVNKGLEAARDRAPDRPVVLLNSDALVSAGWAARLLAPLSDPQVASVTPFSNDAEIFTVPAMARRHDLIPGEGDRLAAAAAGLQAAAPWAEAPTGVGFCMALAPQFLAQVPQFDTAFGRGYGEEVDWCRKVAALGGRHIAAVDVFVEHRGGASFGAAEKQVLLQKSAARLSRRYPGYDAAVRRFVAEDPLATARLALGLTLAAERAGTAPVPIWLAHAMGGGAETDLQARLASCHAAGASGVVLRVGRGLRWTLELHMPEGVTAGVCANLEPVFALISRLPRRRIIYACGVGDRDPVGLPDLLLALAGRGLQAVPGGPQPVEVLLHDYFPISPAYTLLGSQGQWQGVPRPDTAAGADPAHIWTGAARARVDLATWQDRWGRLLQQADRIEVFSRASRDILVEAYPSVAATVEICPHRLSDKLPQLRPGAGVDGKPVIGVLGNIGPHKGADVLERLSRDLAQSGAARLVVIGRLAPEYALAPPSRVHGSYRISDLPGLVARYGISAWLIPSIWPETFSFTTHEALATGLPVMAFGLGAQGAAVAAAQNGIVLPGPDGLDGAALINALQAGRDG